MFAITLDKQTVLNYLSNIINIQFSFFFFVFSRSVCRLFLSDRLCSLRLPHWFFIFSFVFVYCSPLVCSVYRLSLFICVRSFFLLSKCLHLSLSSSLVHPFDSLWKTACSHIDLKDKRRFQEGNRIFLQCVYTKPQMHRISSHICSRCFALFPLLLTLYRPFLLFVHLVCR